MEWISVKNRLPRKDGNSSIYCLVNSRNDGIVVRPYNEYHKVWDDEYGDDHYCNAVGDKITHWMPLPELPAKHKVGDKARVVKNTSDHCFDIGHIGTITESDHLGYKLDNAVGGWLDDEDIEPYSEAITEQPFPTGNGQDVITEVGKDIELRASKGEETYGTRLKTNNGRDALIDAYQEALDLAIYLKQAIMERK